MATYTVQSSAELEATLKSAKGGDTILLAPGEPYSLFAWYGLQYDAPVTITSLNPDNPAAISSFVLQNSKNITLSGLEFDGSGYNERAAWMSSLDVQRSTDIVIENSHFHSSADAFVSTSSDMSQRNNTGISLNDTKNVVFRDNVIEGYFHGLTVLVAENIEITNNTFTKIQTDGIRMGQVQGGLIEGNLLHDFLGVDEAVDHSDMIQLWSSNTWLPSENLTIRDNVLLANGGAASQGIFLNNEKFGSDPNFIYKNILIENNVILNSMTNGIFVGATDGLMIVDNTLVPSANAYATIRGVQSQAAPLINLSTRSTVVTVENNIVTQINGPDGAQLINNLLIQNSNIFQSNHISKLFALGANAFDLGGLTVLPGSLADGRGSSILQPDAGGGALAAVFTTQAAPGDTSAFVFDASLSALLSKADGLQFFWDFGDGATATGQIVEHRFASQGSHVVTLKVIADDGRQVQGSALVKAKDSLLLELTFDNGIFDTSSYGAEVLRNANMTSPTTIDGETAYRLEAWNAFEISRDRSQIFSLSDMTIEVSVRPGAGAAFGGVVLKVHNSYDLTVTNAGEVRFSIVGANGKQAVVETTGAGIKPNVWSDISVVLDSASATLTIYVDGDALATAPFADATQAAGFWGLHVGDLWRSNFIGAVDDIRIWAEPRTPGGAVIVPPPAASPEPEPDDTPAAPQPPVVDAPAAPEQPADPAISVTGALASHMPNYQDFGTAVLSDDGRAVTLADNAWKQFAVSQNVTATTAFELDFTTHVVGEILGVGFMQNGRLLEAHSFRLAGTQAWGVSDYIISNPLDGSSTVRLDLGRYLSGSIDAVVLIADSDAGPMGSATFSNMRFVDNPVEDSFVFQNFRAHAQGVQNFGRVEGSENGVTLEGNAWAEVLGDIVVTRDTVLAFDMEVGRAGEIHGVAFMNGDKLNEATTFHLHGSQAFGRRDYTGQIDGETGSARYELAVGDFFTGRFDRIVFISDDDAAAATLTRFTNLELYDLG
jgi:hypothetical protein